MTTGNNVTNQCVERGGQYTKGAMLNYPPKPLRGSEYWVNFSREEILIYGDFIRIRIHCCQAFEYCM